MTRLMWMLAAVVLALLGYDLLVRDILGWAGWLLIGVGIGIATSVIGSLAHDLLAGQSGRS